MITQITTREFVLTDYDCAVALWKTVAGVEICEGDSREEIEAYLRRNPGLSRVAEENGVMAGAVLCGHDGRRGWLYHLAVARQFRRRGVGRLLLADCVSALRSAGIRRAIVLVGGDNSLGHEFWLQNGWENIDALALTLDLSGRTESASRLPLQERSRESSAPEPSSPKV